LHSKDRGKGGGCRWFAHEGKKGGRSLSMKERGGKKKKGDETGKRCPGPKKKKKKNKPPPRRTRDVGEVVGGGKEGREDN